MFNQLQILVQVLVKNVPADPDESVSAHVDHFFVVNHPDHYLTHQVCHNIVVQYFKNNGVISYTVMVTGV